MSNQKKASQSAASEQYLRMQLREAVKRTLGVRGVLIVGLRSNPTNPDQVMVDVESQDIETVEMIGIIHKLMGDVNKTFSDKGLDIPFPQAMAFVRPVPPPTEG